MGHGQTSQVKGKDDDDIEKWNRSHPNPKPIKSNKTGK